MQHGIASVLGWSQLRPVQDLTIDAVLEGQNAIVLAPTAGGKTEAAFFPILDELHRASPKGVGCVYVSPLRALLNNQDVRVERLAKLVGLKVFKWHGDVGASPRNRFLAEPTEILMTTPESLEVLLMSGRAAEYRLFDGLSYVVIDEVHAFAAGSAAPTSCPPRAHKTPLGPRFSTGGSVCNGRQSGGTSPMDAGLE